MIRQATSPDLSHIMVIYAHARRFMAEHDNPTQWGNTRPTEADISARIARNELFILEDSDGIHGVFAFILGEDPTYHVIENGQWLSDAPYGTIHAVASDGNIHGFLTQVVTHCRKPFAICASTPIRTISSCSTSSQKTVSRNAESFTLQTGRRG